MGSLNLKLSLLLSLVLIVVGQDDKPIINTPPSLTQCLPIALTVGGGEAPYYVTILPGGQPAAEPIETFPTMAQAGQLTWIVDQAPGTELTFQVRDAKGTINYSQVSKVTAGGDCGNVTPLGIVNPGDGATKSPTNQTSPKSNPVPIPITPPPSTTASPPLVPSTPSNSSSILPKPSNASSILPKPSNASSILPKPSNSSSASPITSIPGASNATATPKTNATTISNTPPPSAILPTPGHPSVSPMTPNTTSGPKTPSVVTPAVAPKTSPNANVPKDKAKHGDGNRFKIDSNLIIITLISIICSSMI
ncbi:hypothetical protein DFH28DRAFT_1223703 [Melampsora americana]|nr:hypothetical protein DFH28DRAFT_1223703 [Melampsora americana]